MATKEGLNTGVLPAGMGHDQSEVGVNAEKIEVGKWFDLHVNDSFVVVNAKRITKATKFDGVKPGRNF